MPVIDASVLVEYLAGGTHAEAIRARLLRMAEPLWAPHLIDAEVGHVLRRAVLVRELSPSRAREALVDLAEMPLHRAAHGALLRRAWSLQENMSFYDGMYAALAEVLPAPLLTLDRKLAGVPGLRAPVEVLSSH